MLVSAPPRTESGHALALAKDSPRLPRLTAKHPLEDMRPSPSTACAQRSCKPSRQALGDETDLWILRPRTSAGERATDHRQWLRGTHARPHFPAEANRCQKVSTSGSSTSRPANKAHAHPSCSLTGEDKPPRNSGYARAARSARCHDTIRTGLPLPTPYRASSR